MYLIQTVQTSWRPQLPLPKELDDDASDSTDEQSAAAADAANMERSAQHRTTSHGSSRKDNTLSGAQAAAQQTSAASASNKKWSFGRLFRRKKEIATESSSEEDRKAGFVPHQQRQPPRVASGATASSANLKTKSSKTHKVSRSGKLNGASFDHIVVSPQTSGAPSTPPHPPPPAHVDHEFFLPVETISPTEAYYQNQQQQYLQHGAQPAAYTRSANSLDRRAARAALKTRSAQRLPHESAPGAHSSSEEELISLNSSTFSKYRSDESIHSGGQGAANAQNSRRSRAARNERYYKRLSRDGEPSSGQVPVMYAPQPTQRWKTQPVPLSIYNPAAQAPTASAAAAAAATPRLRNTSSLQHVAPYVQWGQLQQQPKNLQNTVNDSKRSISYDSHIHLQNINGRLQTKPLPPPPPPRDPLRRVNVSGQMQNGSAGDLRPISYAFDQSGLPTLPATNQRMGGRCVSDDKIWSGPAGPHYQSVHSLNTPSAGVTQPMPQGTPHHRRFITRAERDAHPAKKSLPNGIEFHYVADATPRSRKPIHMLEPQLDATGNDVATTGILRTSKSGLPTASSKQMQVNDFWKRLDASTHQRGRDTTRAYALESNVKPRSISSSRVGELRAYPIPVYSEVQKPNKKRTQAALQPGADEVDSIVCGSLHIKSKPDSNSNFVEIRNKDYNKSSSMPNHYQRRSGEIPNTPNKYDEYVAEKREQHHKPIFTPPTPPQRKLSIPPSNAAPELPIYFPRKKPANLEEAINELEAIYKSLGLTEEPEKKERVPTPSEFEKYALAHAHEYDDEDSPTGEPDPIRDDVAYRNMQLANLQHKTVDKQPPFGIPVGPVVAAPQNDYLHVTPIVEPIASVNTPDIVKDDLAVRALRKDPPGAKDKFIYPYSSFQKKHRATRTQSANIYNLIHRDAAKPSGGDLHSYLELTRSLERAGSMSDLHKDAGATAADVPTTLALLRNLKEQDQQQQQQLTPQKKVAIPFRHPSQGGAICALPEKLPTSSAHKEEVHKQPVPLPRKSLTPEPTAANAQMEDALNKIAMDAQEKSEKLTKELQELRKEALITAARPKAASAEEERLEKDLQEIEAVSEAAKRCGKMLLDTLPDASESTVQAKPRKLHKEGKLIEAIDQVSEAANAVCEKILKDIVTTEPPVVIQEAVQVKNKQTPTEMLVMPNLIKKLDPIQSEQIEAIAKRCMRQLSALADDNPDYDNLNQELQQQQQQQSAAGAATAVACNVEHLTKASAAKVDNLISTVAEVTPVQPAAAQKQHTDIEEIDQIMQECEEQMRAETINSSTTTAPPPIVLSERTLATTRPLGTANTKNSSGDDHTTAPSMTTSSYCSSSSSNNVVGAAKPGASTTASSFSSSSDCLAKSSSPSAGRRQSSSITSFNPYSSSDYIKSPSSEYHAPSTDPIKTFSSTSYDVKSTTSAATPNISATTNSTFSYSPSPPLNLTPVSETAAIIAAEGGRAASATRQSQERTRTRSSSSPSQYNSSEELAMIFGIDEQPRRQRAQQQAKEMQSATKVSGKTAVTKSVHVPSAPLTSSSHASALHATMLDTATNTTTTTTTTTIYTTANATQLYTNPNLVAVAEACENVAPVNTNNTAPLNVIAVVDDNVEVVVVDIDVKDTTTTTTTTTSISTITTNNPTTIAINTNLKNSSTSLSPSSYKLASIPETQADELSECTSSKLSPNFNKIYASKISIIVDGMRAEQARNVELTAHCDTSLSSCEDETSSNPDSGNVSLADYPLTNTQTNNACLQLESAYNSRFEIKKKKRNFVSEIAIERTAVESNTEGEYKSKTDAEDFPPPPSEEELLDSLLGAISVGDAEKETIESVELQDQEITRESTNSGILESQFELLEVKENMQGTYDSFEAQITDKNSYKASSLSENDMKTESIGECASNEYLLESQNRELQNLDESIISENSFESQNENIFFTGSELSESLGAENALKEHAAFTAEESRTEQQKPKPIERKSRSSKKLDDADLIELAQLVRSSSGSRRNSEASTADTYSADSEYNSAEELKCTATACINAELEQLRLAFSDILERNLTDIDELPRIEEEDDIVATLLNHEEKEENTVSEHIELNDEIHETPRRKLSVVYETPSLNLNISEVKISYTPADQLESESTTQEALTQLTQCNAEVKQHKALPETRLKAGSSAAAPDSGSLLPWRRRHAALEEDEKPSTSAAAAVKATSERRALSIFGELRPTAAATSSLTTLEHVLMACSLGVITPTDLYTLCLIIIGMITIIAIVLF
ncbi:uncharacterized protein LOC120776737 isoform X2 [Bactrocera tryoni]|uniref:uncharacterized protein LOC120776737 isoform X2 n=1 Tax=Bactrocera tryoni TaxID=59916 RepID=UPI001A98FFFD|nr:uncharacterized protein LOC120776737 isoform X2 [Bactrocera tryoni]